MTVRFVAAWVVREPSRVNRRVAPATNRFAVAADVRRL
jgi:hypothetical protein